MSADATQTFITEKSQLISSEILNLLNEKYVYIENWKWLALVALFFVAYLFRFILNHIIVYVKKLNLSIYQLSFYKHFSRNSIEKPIASVLALLFVITGLHAISPGEKLTEIVSTLLKVLIIYHLIVLSYHAANALGDAFEEFSSKTKSTIDDQLARIVKKTLRVLVVIMGVLIGLQNLGVNVTALLAGLGIGGVALAFAAQDTVSNVFGTITILFDSPFRMGDRILVSGFDGVVEEVGFRSTRIRTLTNSVVTIPNSVIAKENIENLSLRSHYRLRHVFGLEYTTPYEKIDQFCIQIRELLEKNQYVDKNRIVVYFNEYAESSLNVLMSCHLKLPDSVLDLSEQHQILGQIYHLADSLQIKFAFPSRTVYLENQKS